MSWTTPGYRNVQYGLELHQRGVDLKGLTYEIVVGSEGGRQ
jgi:hypothetical protein